MAMNIEANLKKQPESNLDRVNNEKNKAIVRAMSTEEKKAVLVEFPSYMLLTELLVRLDRLEAREDAFRDILRMEKS